MTKKKSPTFELDGVQRLIWACVKQAVQDIKDHGMCLCETIYPVEKRQCAFEIRSAWKFLRQGSAANCLEACGYTNGQAPIEKLMEKI